MLVTPGGLLRPVRIDRRIVPERGDLPRSPQRVHRVAAVRLPDMCDVPIAPRDNVPILSWLYLRGRCRNCHSPISMRYPLIEAATAGLFAGVAARIGFSWTLPAYLVLAAGLLALACTDMEHLLLPKRIVYPVLGLVGALLVLAPPITNHWHNLSSPGSAGPSGSSSSSP
jgi:prepilin signal peptidase PulO-like enzyme (type II secretory pathway)